MPLIPLFRPRGTFVPSHLIQPKMMAAQPVYVFNPSTGLMDFKYYKLVGVPATGNKKLLGLTPGEGGIAPACCTIPIRRCSDDSLTGGYLGVSPGMKLPTYFKDPSDNACYYVYSDPIYPCTVHPATVTSYDVIPDCTFCRQPPPCSGCPGGWYFDGANDVWKQFPGVIANTSYTILNAATLNLAGDPQIVDNGRPPWDGVLVADRYDDPRSHPDECVDPEDSSCSSSKSCIWRGEEEHKQPYAIAGDCLCPVQPSYNPNGEGNSGHTVSGAVLTLQLPQRCNTPQTFTCDGPSGPTGTLTATTGTYWLLTIGGFFVGGGQITVWEGILVDSPTPAGTYKFCPNFYAGDIVSYAGDLVVA